MADEEDREEAPSFEIARAVKGVSHYAKRDPAGATVHPSGRTDLNVNGTEQFIDMAISEGLDEHEFSVMLGGNTATGLVGAYPVRESVEGAMGFRRNEDRTITLYLHGVFSDYPQLRPEGIRDCKVTKRKDAKGKWCLVINLNAGLVKRRGKRGSDSSGSETQSS